MAVKIGTVATFADVKADKAQAVKILEESAEIFGAWQCCELLCDVNAGNDCMGDKCKYATRRAIVDECADIIQATCNLLAALGVDDLTAVMDRCKQKNIERGREYAE